MIIQDMEQIIDYLQADYDAYADHCGADDELTVDALERLNKAKNILDYLTKE